MSDNIKKGRPKGSPNKNSLTVRAAANNLGFNAVKEFLIAYQELKDPTEKIEALRFLFRYMYPMLKDVEVNPETLMLDMLDNQSNPRDIDTIDLLEAVNKV